MSECASRATRSIVAALALVSLIGCNAAELDSKATPELQTRTDAIVGGTTAAADPQVFMLLLFYSNGSQSRCSATLINRRTLLTSAHCVDPRIGNSQSMDIWATNETYALATNQPKLFRVGATALHPSWDPSAGTLDFDVALALLDEAPTGVTAKPWNMATVTMFQGRPLRALGYGTVGPNAPTSSGVKREAALTFRLVTNDRIFLGDGTSRGVCYGDSGGPSFHTFADGVERVVGVHSYTVNAGCTDGADIRVDVHSAWINAWLNANEGPSCIRDGACVQGCTPVDPDCVCVADGVCSAQCLNPEDDPDCPLNCGEDGVCQATGCATADLDCVEDGQPCGSALVCPGRRCVNDPQHDALYCSRSCGASSECPQGMGCEAAVCRYLQLPNIAPNGGCTPGQSYCVGKLRCAGTDTGPTRCAASCTSDDQCPKDAPCTDGPQGRFCFVPLPEPVSLRLAETAGPVAASCSSVPGTLPVIACVVAGWAARRRRNVRGASTSPPR